ncbi:DWARF open reading frame [Pteropus alecto]|uniref:Small transmembrane regulator of ion transport 1 n=1 Tax=Rousettus aegyptiacus TaxID=9407 RepID=A0A7J8HPZ8_ROUAE|nr:DWARF open reading frame [Pteropus alecto]XP_036075513.1 sarcoplasmic/endoplasmic reticulum calcium ATPase regulator DWORF [Rousettus aegyptiacus]XP_036075514.1 sarcoplasmic/endoplasmic reticulum calcium ATPase regulator DWORF [Rousettus aegyptiacus]XP_036075515.1 sarcoplasmic/endoplasmic reticulum calcium ATPase regulator DWORF [Rousettus aegyptiacus]XP_036075516.1 sarcoplasmic/endoplasmic reticulum calcium ATPase regulator DWORF [Rousettus aegyptiacus]XP_036075517.1 sarcoplasmic/endoplasm
MAEKESTSSHLLVPVLLLVGWIVGCIIMVYVVFS